MRSKLPDNVTSQIDDLVSRVRLAKDDKESAEIARQFADDLQERIDSERLEAASRLAAWLAHRINNPLGAISGNAQLLARHLE
ncbi:MAG TPA: histidine kinase dimerization/phospho-acceptor domain-containing protein, partial [Armatimonadota bacterium]|nr:histidine kinase dimerization/phospho-acceptor domain-containing protein [Armatimonadota bacterium]